MSSSNNTGSAVPRRRRIWRWLLAGTLVFVGAATLAAYNLVTLPRDPATLRDELTATLTQSVRTRVQVTAGPILLTAARVVLSFIKDVPEEARIALSAVRNASVGVYELRESISSPERSRLFTAADALMQKRGWTRVVGVKDVDTTVLVYLPAREPSGSSERVCVAVCSDHHLVVVSGKVRLDRLVDLAVQQRLIARR
jgi:hypothetical protein